LLTHECLQAGLYSFACAPHLNGYHSIKYPPDDVAIADWNGTDSAFGVHTGCIPSIMSACRVSSTAPADTRIGADCRMVDQSAGATIWVLRDV
jgi:hypothetical protein